MGQSSATHQLFCKSASAAGRAGAAYTRAASLSRIAQPEGCANFAGCKRKQPLARLWHVCGCFVILERSMSRVHETPVTARKAQCPSLCAAYPRNRAATHINCKHFKLIGYCLLAPSVCSPKRSQLITNHVHFCSVHNSGHVEIPPLVLTQDK